MKKEPGYSADDYIKEFLNDETLDSVVAEVPTADNDSLPTDEEITNMTANPIEDIETQTIPDQPEVLENLIEQTNESLEIAYSELTDLAQIKEAIFSPEKVDDGHRKGIHEIVSNISTRHFGTVEYHKEIEKYNDAPDDTPEVHEQKHAYRKAILIYAQKLGFIGDKPLQPANEFEKKMNLASNPEKYDGPVEAIIVPGAAALSNYKRFYHSLKSIATGAIDTDRIVFATCGRNTPDAEKKTMSNAGYGEGATEFDLQIQAVQDIAGGFINEPVESERTVNLNGNEYPVRVLSGQIMVEGKTISVDIVESPYDRTRKDERGNLAKRANTEETFFSAMTVLDNDTPDKTICIASHDTWKPCQHIAAQYIFGGYFGKNVISSGPDNLDRLRQNADGELDINAAEAVVDEMSKYLDELDKLDVFLAEQNILRLFNKTMSDKHKILFTNKMVRG